MGRIGTFKQVKLVDVDGEKAGEITLDFGADDVATALFFSPAGVISKPINGDLALVVDLEGGEEYAAVGFIDVNFDDPSGDGEVYLRARDGDGVEVASIHIKASGEVAITNGSGTFKLGSDGVFNANSHLTVDP